MIKVMIAEDEKLVREELEYLLSKYSQLILLPSVNNGKELLEKYEELQPDVLFLDIHMPELEGIDVARAINARSGTSPLMVFTTAYDEYAVEAFRLHALDYLLKPYDEEQLAETIRRIEEALEKRTSTSSQTEAEQLSSTAKLEVKGSKLLIDDGESFFVVDPNSIYYVTREERLLYIHTINKVYTSRLTLQELEQKLSGFHFFRSHRSFLVNLNYVAEIMPWFNGAYNLRLEHDPKLKIPVSRIAAKELFKRLEL